MPEPTDRRTAILILWRRALITITAIGAIAASFIFLTDLAIHAGWHPWAAWLLPFCVDALAAMALTIYRLTGNRAAATISVLVIAFSALGNAASHWFTTGLLDNGWSAEPFMTPHGVTVTIVGAVPAVALGLCVHLATKEGPVWASQNPGRGEWNGTGTSQSSTIGSGRYGTSPDAHGSGTRGSSPPSPIPTRSTAAPGAAPSPGSTATTGTGPPTASTSDTAAATTRPTRSRKRTDTELISTVSMNSWHGMPLDQLASRLSVSKSRAKRIRDAAQSPSSSSGQPSDPERAVAAL